jgi:hypothetical protein
VARMGEGENCARFWWEIPKERDDSEDRGVDGRMRSEWILGRLVGVVDSIRLAQDRDRWRNLVDTVINFRVLAPQIWFVS